MAFSIITAIRGVYTLQVLTWIWNQVIPMFILSNDVTKYSSLQVDNLKPYIRILNTITHEILSYKFFVFHPHSFRIKRLKQPQQRAIQQLNKVKKVIAMEQLLVCLTLLLLGV